MVYVIQVGHEFDVVGGGFRRSVVADAFGGTSLRGFRLPGLGLDEAFERLEDEV